MRDRVSRAAGAIGTSPERRQEQSLESARELVRGMEAMRDRGEAAARAAEAARQGQQGRGEQPGEGQGQQPGRGVSHRFCR